MILDPINDHDCLDQLTRMARELAPTTLIREVARRLGSREAVIKWVQSLPQADDDGSEHVRFIQCDVPQRVRLLPDDPNCVERAMGAAMLLEVVDPKTPRALATIDKPLRHTGLVEKKGAQWRALDLFPRRNTARNFDWGAFGKDALQGVHKYVGKPILSFYGMGGAADTVGQYEDKAIGRDKKKQPEKNGAPPSDAKQPKSADERSQQQSAKQPRPKADGTAKKPVRAKRLDYARLIAASGAGASSSGEPPPVGEGGKDAEGKAKDHHAGAPAVDGAAGPGGATPSGDGDGGDSDRVDAGAAPSSQWWFLGR